jgi:predicted RNA-binding Zn ribbon-like protein
VTATHTGSPEASLYRLPAPSPDLRRLQAFVNTNEIEAGRDALATPRQLHEWLVAAGAIEARDQVTGEAHARAIAVREGIRALALANNDRPLQQDLVAAMNRATRRSMLVPTVEDSANWHLAPATRGVDGFLGSLAGTLVTAMADGSWSRVKGCGNDACQWVFFDQSRNHSGTWCSMAECGSRMKARAYRARHRAEHTST